MALGEIADTYRFLLGVWQLERTLHDHRIAVEGALSGEVSIEEVGPAAPQWARYREAGRLSWGAYSGTARRSLTYARREDGAVAIAFDDGHPFVTCDLRTGGWAATHWCRDDRYEIGWRVRSHDVVVERWRVRGPGKAYDASSVMRRAAHGAAPERGDRHGRSDPDGGGALAGSGPVPGREVIEARGPGRPR